MIQIANHVHDPLGCDAYLRRYWRYQPDPIEFEFVQGPRLQIEQAEERGFYAGDCDDASTLAACILVSLGWPCRFVAYRMSGNPEFSHVNLRAVAGPDGAAFDIDPTVPIDRLPVMSEEIAEVWL